MALAPEQKLTYKEGGPAAEARFEAGVAGFEARSFRGCGVMTSEPFEVSDDNESLQMLTRNSQIGEFYVIEPAAGASRTATARMYTCDIMIFDEERDAPRAHHAGTRRSKATPRQAVEKVGQRRRLPKAHGTKTWSKGSGRRLRNGPRRPPRGPIQPKGTATEPPRRTPDVRIVVARPFIEHPCTNVIMAVSGRDTGPVGRSNLRPTPHSPRPHRLPPNHRRRHALRPGGHAALGQHPGQDHRGPL